MQIESTARIKRNLLATATSNEIKSFDISKSTNDTKKLTRFLNSAPKKALRGTKKRNQRKIVSRSVIICDK